MTRTAYNALLAGTFACVSPYVGISALFNLHGMRKRLGIADYTKVPGPERPFWFHAASMGEVIVLTPFVRELKKRYPHTPVVLTTVTSTGQDRCRTMIPEADLITLLPLDVPFIINRFIRKIKPSHLFIAETELWPNMILGVRRRGGHVLLINGKISRKSTGRYLLAGRLIRETMQAIAFFGLQRTDDRDRFSTLGARPETLHVLGNVKFDLSLFVDRSGIDRNRKRQELGIGADTPVFIAGSTRPGEEPVILDAMRRMYRACPDLRTIMVPRHLKRLDEVEALVAAAGFTCSRRSALPAGTPSQVILVDTMGELLALYAAADLAFVGGSLADFGGHNPLEPALFGVPVLFGPHMRNNAASAAALRKQGGACEITDADGLAHQAATWLEHPDNRMQAGRNAHDVITANAGMVQRYLEAIYINKIL